MTRRYSRKKKKGGGKEEYKRKTGENGEGRDGKLKEYEI
jgi:hypothetical protein